jgi:hypothetical protein
VAILQGGEDIVPFIASLYFIEVLGDENVDLGMPQKCSLHTQDEVDLRLS